MARGLPARPQANGSIWVRHTAARLQAPQRHFLGQAQSSSQSFLPLLHPRHRKNHLGRQKLQVAPHLPLQAHERSQSRQADESVWEIFPPEAWEKEFGKHPTQKPVALLERILLASSNEGDLVLDPFSGSGTTLLAALRLCRHALGCELSAEFLGLGLRRICSNLVQVETSVSSFDFSFSNAQFSLDPVPDPMDRSNEVNRLCRARLLRRAAHWPNSIVISPPTRPARTPLLLHRPPQARTYLRCPRRLPRRTRQKFRAFGRPDSDALLIVKTETEIYLA
jgi:DNA methylase